MVRAFYSHVANRVSVLSADTVLRAIDNMVQIKNERMYVERKMVFIAAESCEVWVGGGENERENGCKCVSCIKPLAK